jgi:hypothetical protein
MDTKKSSPKREINPKATLMAIKERQERLSQIKEKKMKDKDIEENAKLFTGLKLLYNIMKRQNKYLLNDVNTVFKEQLPFNCDLQSEFIKPPYLVPKIVSHKVERHLNSM